MSNIASYYGVNSQTLQRHYKHKVSGFKQWNQLPHAENYLLYPENITDRLSIDEVSLSKGELYTFLTNKNSPCIRKLFVQCGKVQSLQGANRVADNEEWIRSTTV